MMWTLVKHRDNLTDFMEWTLIIHRATLLDTKFHA